jgi:hypothetical protein
MIGLKVFRQFVGNPFRLLPIIEFLGGKAESVIRAIVDAEDLEPEAVLIAMGKNDCGHGFYYI